MNVGLLATQSWALKRPQKQEGVDRSGASPVSTTPPPSRVLLGVQAEETQTGAIEHLSNVDNRPTIPILLLS
jgi:hypothetical protein